MTLVLLALLAPAASANRWSDHDVALAMQVADAHWPGAPCTGHHIIAWMTGAQLDGLFPEDRNLMVEARGDVGGCHVWVAWDRLSGSPVWLCSILEHEYGHNLGLTHSADPTNIMFAAAPMAEDCRRAFRRRARLHSFTTKELRRFYTWPAMAHGGT